MNPNSTLRLHDKPKRPRRLPILIAACVLFFTACTTTTPLVLDAPTTRVAPRLRLVNASQQGLFDETPDEPPIDDVARRRCDIEFVGNDLTGNRHNGLPVGHLQVVLFYDGATSGFPELTIELDGGEAITIGGAAPGGPIESFGRSIETREYALYGCLPTGEFDVAGLEPNGVIDGLAFGLLWRDESGRYTMLKSNAPQRHGGAALVGMWPLGLNNDQLLERTPEISTGFGRESARTIIVGAALVENGHHSIAVPKVADR